MNWQMLVNISSLELNGLLVDTAPARRGVDSTTLLNMDTNDKKSKAFTSSMLSFSAIMHLAGY